MFRRAPRTFSARRRPASSGSSSSEEEPGAEPAPGRAPAPAPAPASPQDPGTAAAEGPQPAERPVRSRAGVLSFGSEEEREVTFRVQKKKSLLPAQREAEESKTEICDLEPGTGNSEDTDEEKREEESYSSQSEDNNSADSENESTPPGRRKDLSPVNIPSAACIESARRKRHLARAQADYLPLDVSNGRQVSRRRESSEESEDESDMKNLSFAPKMRTLRQRMTEHMVSVSDESSEDEAQMKWEEQQIKKAVKLSQVREQSQKADHHEGMSSDDELTPTEVTEFQESKDNILEDSRKIFEDVHADFCDIRKILLKFQEWKEKFPDSYCDAYVSFCLPKLLNPLIRVQLINWNPLESSTDLAEMPWFRAVEEFSNAENSAESKRNDDPDQEVLPRVIEKTVLPKIAVFVQSVWDPLSTSQTENLVQVCRNIFEKQVPSKSEGRKAKEDLIKEVVLRMKKSIEEDVFIPLYPKSIVEDKSSPGSKFQERRFWSALKLLSSVLLWNGIVQEDVVRDLGLSKLLNRYLLLNLLNTPPGPDNIEKCTKVVACLPERWFEDLGNGSTLPELLNFCQHLLQCARVLHKNNHSDETKEVILLLVKVKALHIVEDFIEEYKLEHLKSLSSRCEAKADT
ncbi:GC-rich sequence DNA-binding factor 2 isoform X2 [Aix galericulata]|nr:GC-rich sequence DNA-binding factor 2 isoform X2 [Aix galericulata]